jgi:flagellar assembly protein FliH
MAAKPLSETPSSYAFEQLEPSAPLPPGTPARIVAEAHEEAAHIREVARAEGFAEGREAGHHDGLAETSSAALAFGGALQGVQDLREEIAEAVERDAVELALALSSKIVAGALELQPERVIDVVRGALRRVSERRRITVLVDPADLEVINAAIGELRAQAGGIELCEVQADRRVGRGGAIVRTAEGEVDASVETQLERARELALSELQKDESEQTR